MASTASVNTVTGYFDTILQRSGSEVSAAEINSYATALDSGALTADQIRNALISSDEGQDVQFVIRLYQSFFGRVPDEAGLNFQVDALRNGASIVDVANGFAASPEFSARFGSNEVTDAFITSVYAQVLGRAPSTSEIDFYKNSGFDAGRIALAFSESPEFTQLTSTVTANFLNNAALGTQTYEGPLALGNVFTLTAPVSGGATGVDTFTGTGFADTFNAVINTSASDNTLASGDSINGAGGIDTLNLTTDGTTFPSNVTISNVENINVIASGATTLTASAFGAEARQFTVQNSTDAVTIGGLAATNSIGIAGAATSATFNFASAATAGTNDAATLNLTGANASGTVTIGSGIETVNLSGTGFINSLAASSATALNIAAGSAGITLTSTQNFTTVDASTSTGDVNATLTLSSSTTDSATITGGAGNDTFALTNFAAADVLNGGAGFDTLSVAGGNYSSASAAAPFTDIASIERVVFTGSTGATLDGATFVNSGITNIEFNGSGNDTITNAGSARTYEFGTSNSGTASFTMAAGATTLNVDLLGGTTANPADADVGNLTVALDSNAASGTVATLNLTSAGVTGSDVNDVGALTLVAGSTVNIDGSADLTIASLGNATNVNASAFTGHFTLTGSTGADTIVGGTGLNTITGGDGNDTITGGSGSSTTVAAGSYVNTLIGGNGADTINGGSGVNEITGGAGVDTINISSSTGSDLIHLNGIISEANRDFITGFQAGTNGDVIQITASDTSATTLATAAPVVQAVTAIGATTFAASSDIVSFNFNVAGNGLANATDGSALLAQVGSIDAAADGGKGYIIAYQGGNAYVYYAAETAASGGSETDAALSASDIHLVGVVNNVAVGSLTAANFDLA